jgi:mono/diheme cytochrome c family protein
MKNKALLRAAGALVFVSLFIAVPLVQSQNDPASLTGNADRGRTLFTKTFNCASCHGSTAVSGSPRLLPMRRTQEQFITYVQKPTANAMPTYGDQPAQALADVYAYLKSLKEPSPPPVQNIPILNDVLKTIP